MILTKTNYLLYSAQAYMNSSCIDTEEFLDDLKRINYIKKLFNKYKKTGELNERLVLNHLVVLTNVFKVDCLVKMLFFELENFWDCLKPFLSFMNIIPKYIEGIGANNVIIFTDEIPSNISITDKLNSLLENKNA